MTINIPDPAAIAVQKALILGGFTATIVTAPHSFGISTNATLTDLTNMVGSSIPSYLSWILTRTS